MWAERTQDFYKSPRSLSPSRSVDRNAVKSPSVSVSRATSVDREEGDRPIKRQRFEYAVWIDEFPPPTSLPDPVLAVRFVFRPVGGVLFSRISLQEHIAHEFDYKRAGKNVNREIRSKKNFKNPDIIDLLSREHNILEIGTNFKPEIFDPFIYPAEAFYDSLDKKQTDLYLKEEEAKKQASKQNTRVIDFVTASKAGKK